MSFQTLVERLREMFPKQYQTEVEEFIASKNPKTTADVEQLIQQYNYRKTWPNA
jgi:hypothetical protein